MQVGMHLSYQNLTGMPDAEFFAKETQLAIEAEAMGFDFVGPVEHHFTDYAACPDPFQMLAFVAAKTSRIKLVTAAIILPWNNPLRVVEQASVLDILSEGRLILGLGRGAARREFRSFGVDLADSREMFDEAALIILEGVETGIVEANGKHYQIPRTEIRPRPPRSFQDRVLMVAMSPSSVDIATRYGLRSLRFSQGDWRMALPDIESYRKGFRLHHGREAPPLMISDFAICFDDQQTVIETTDRYFGKLYETVADHYEIGGDHFKSLPSYGAYLSMGEAAEAAGGVSKAYKDYIGANLIGTPDAIVEQHLARRELLGDYDVIINFSFGGLPYDMVYDQAKRFADKVLPRLKG